MLQGIDDLSIEELQNQLLEIQRKIKEKEKDGLIEKVASGLKEHDLEFIHEVLAIVEGKKSLEKAVRKDRPAGASKPFRIGKTEVYLRNGKVFFGIQEIKYTRLDKNGTLRISKEGKGLPPKVSSLPPHLQKVVLSLPQKGASSVESNDEPNALGQHPEPSDQALESIASSGATAVDIAPEEAPVPSIPPQVGVADAEPIESSDSPEDSSADSDQPDLSASPEEPAPRRRKTAKTKSVTQEEESSLPMELDRGDTSTPARKPERISLQESLF